MKFLFRLAIFAFSISLALSVWAGPEKEFVSNTQTDTDKVPLDIVETESSYVFQSDLNHGGSFGEQNEIQNEFSYAHRFLLTGNLYLRLGLEYDRFDFSKTDAPVPVHLQSAAGVVGLDYMHGSDLAAFLWVKPGFYTEEHIGLSSFDAPITLGRIFVLQTDTLYLFAGANAAFLRGGYPVVPLAGIIYEPNKQWTVNGILPEPRVIYSPNELWSFWGGGELTGGSFRTDHDDHMLPSKLSGTQVDYEDYRAGLGVMYTPCKAVTFNLGGGYSIERAFKFHRAGENYRTDPAPYLQFELKANF